MFAWWRRRDGAAAAEARWVVVDVETSGLNLRADALLSIGGVAMRSDGAIVPADSLEILVRPEVASGRDNILVHGIGVAAQMAGAEPRQAAERFLDFVGACPILAFHAPFDRGFLARAVKAYVNQPFDNPWLDLAELAPVLDGAVRAQSLDDWLAHYGIPLDVRHSAAADAFATAQLAARLLTLARRQGARDFPALQRLARAARWTPR